MKDILIIIFSLLMCCNLFAQNPGNALDFDGSNDYVSIPDAAALDITNQITIEAWFKPSSSSWAYKKLITIDNTKVLATLSNFPVLVSITDVDLKDSDNGGPIQPDGDDILFINTDGTKLSHEIEKYDGSTGQLAAWVKIPSLSSSTDTEFFLYYGNSSCSSQQDAANVWDSNYEGVWHLNEIVTDEQTSGTHYDSTPNGKNGTQKRNDDIPGKIANGQDFDGTNDYIDIPTLSSPTNKTYSLWIYPNSMTENFHTLIEFGNDAPFFGLAIFQGNWYLLEFDKLCWGKTSLSTGQWHHVVYTSNSGTNTGKVYLNGVEDTETPANANTETGSGMGIAFHDIDDPFNGIIDEVRVSNIARSSDWISTCYNNQSNPGTFMSFSNQTAAGVSKSGAYGISTNNTKAYGTINNQGVSGSITASEWNHISLTYDKDAGGTDEIKLYLDGTLSATGDYSTAISTNNNNMLLGDMAGFLGKMDEIRLWNDVRTQQEVRDNMHRIVTPGSESNLVAYWKLNQSSGTSAADSKGSNTGTLFNMTDGDWVASTAPFGGGIVNSTTSFTSGTANLGTFSLTTTNSFDNPVDIISTEILNAPNILPSVTNQLDDRYWVADVFGTPGTYTTKLTFTLPSGYLDIGDAANLKLYNRSGNSDGSWTLLVSGAANVTSTTVTFNGVTTLGQFTIGSSGSPLPVELVSFTGKVKDQKVYLNWSTATEVNNYGFEVERKNPPLNPLQGGDFERVGFVEGHGNSNSPKEYSFIDAEVNSSGIYYYRLKQIDNDGAYVFSNQIEVNFNVPIKFELSQNYPNPFNPSTTISFTLAVNEIVSLSVYNMLGEEIQILQKGFLEAGMYSYNFNAEGLPSGFYIYKLSSNNKIQTRKMLLLK